mgnify:CR=1 FL=1
MPNTNRKELALAILTVAAGLANAYLWQGVIGVSEFHGAALISQAAIREPISSAVPAREQVEHMLEPWRAYLPYAAAATFLIAVKTLTIPLYWLVLPIFALTLRLLVAVGLARQRTETIQAERITL